MKKIAASENVLAATDPPAPRGAVCYYQSWRCAVVTVVAVAFLFRSGAEAVDATACNDTTDTAGSSRFCPEGWTFGCSMSREEFMQMPHYSIKNTGLPSFTAEPKSTVVVRRSSVNLFCNITAVSEFDSVEFSWLLNGAEIQGSTSYTITTVPLKNAISSVLHVSNFDEKSQGVYQCRVQLDGRWMVSSDTANLYLPQFFGWIRSDGSTLTSNFLDEIAIQSSGTAVLQCNPNATAAVAKVTWLLNNTLLLPPMTANGLPVYFVQGGSVLVVYNVTQQLLGGKGPLAFRCIVTFSDGLKDESRSFLLSAEDLSTPLNFTLTPNSRTVVEGSDLALFCVTGGRSTLSSDDIGQHTVTPTITWYKDNRLIAGKEDPGYAFQFLGESVLFVRNVTADVSGKYSCVASDGKDFIQSTAATISVELPLSAASLRVVQEEFGSAALILVCEATENSEHAEHTWLFQGKPLPPPPMFSTQSGGARLTLNPTAADPWDIIGAVQCRVENVAGSVSVATQVRFAGEVSPPRKVEFSRDVEDGLHYFMFKAQWAPPDMFGGGTSGIAMEGYRLQVWLEPQTIVCTRFATGNTSGFNAIRLFTDFVGFRVATVTSSGLSDFNVLPNLTLIHAPPPPPSNLSVLSIDPMTNETGHWFDVTLGWQPPSNALYPHLYYDTEVQLQCNGSKEVPTVLKTYEETTESVNLSGLDCCSECRWCVVLVPIGLSSPTARRRDASEQCSRFNTSYMAIEPMVPPVLNHLQRTGTNGTAISLELTLPEPSLVCACSPPILLVRYTNSTAKMVEEVQIPDYSELATEYKHTLETVLLHRAVCWDQYNVSIAYKNSASTTSPFTEFQTLWGLSDADRSISTAFSQVTSTEATIAWTLNSKLECLMFSKNANFTICHRMGGCETTNNTITLSDDLCHFPIPARQLHFKIPDLHKNAEHCILVKADAFHLKDSLSLTTMEDVPDAPPSDLRVVVANESVFVAWSAPSPEEMNGELVGYLLSISVSGQEVVAGDTPAAKLVVNVTTGSSYRWKEFQTHTSYLLSVSACTGVGCGPPANATYPDPELKDKEAGNTLIMITAVGAVVVAVVLVTVCVTGIMCVRCVIRRKRDQQLETELLVNQMTDPPSRDLVDPTECNSVSTGTSTQCDPLAITPIMEKYLRDVENYGGPDGSEGSFEMLEENAGAAIEAVKLNVAAPIPRNGGAEDTGIGEDVELSQLDLTRGRSPYVLDKDVCKLRPNSGEKREWLLLSSKGRPSLVQQVEITRQPVPPLSSGYVHDTQNLGSTLQFPSVSATAAGPDLAHDLDDDNDSDLILVPDLYGESETPIFNIDHSTQRDHLNSSGYVTEQVSITGYTSGQTGRTTTGQTCTGQTHTSTIHTTSQTTGWTGDAGCTTGATGQTTGQTGDRQSSVIEADSSGYVHSNTFQGLSPPLREPIEGDTLNSFPSVPASVKPSLTLVGTASGYVTEAEMARSNIGHTQSPETPRPNCLGSFDQAIPPEEDRRSERRTLSCSSHSSVFTDEEHDAAPSIPFPMDGQHGRTRSSQTSGFHSEPSTPGVPSADKHIFPSTTDTCSSGYTLDTWHKPDTVKRTCVVSTGSNTHTSITPVPSKPRVQ